MSTLEGLDGRGRLSIDPVIHAECAMGVEGVDRMLAELDLGCRELSRDALFLAGTAFLRYRRRGGTKAGVLPDFFIGAHAAVERLALVTRDERRFASYFPTIDLISPRFGAIVAGTGREDVPAHEREDSTCNSE